LAAQDVQPGISALHLYVRPTLLWNDVVFAVALSSFTALMWLTVAVSIDGHPFVKTLTLFFAVMGVGYGFADVAEDICLARFLSQSAPLTDRQAMLACRLTQLKLVTIVLSVLGAATFFILSAIERCFR
jgi:hypothetical protein